MPHPFLPKRKSGTENRFSVPSSPGVWEDRPHSHLGELAEAIEIPPTQSRIYSVPDPWARAVLFDRALFDEAHPLHETTKGEWRGLLALIGMKVRRNLEGMTVTKVDLRHAGQVQGSFTSVLARLMPQDNDRLAADSDWQQFYLMRWKLYEHSRPRAFGITSPLTLVCAAADYADVLPREISWYDGRVLCDPKDHLSKRERIALAEWLRVLVQKMPTGTRSQRRGWVIDHLKDFYTSLADEKEPTAADVLSDRRLGFNHGIYKELLDLPRKGETGTVSDVEIITSADGAPRYLLIDPSLEHQFNEPAREIVVYGDNTLATSSVYTRTGKTSDLITAGIHWCTPDFFFSDTLVYEANGTNAFPGCMPVKFNGDPRKRSIALPLSSDVLSLFKPQTLAENFAIDWQSDGSAICRLKLRLRTSQGERNCVIQKTYNDDSMLRIQHLPMICIWPNFRLAVGWKIYFTFQNWYGTEQDELSVEPWSSSEPQPTAHRRLELDNRRFQIYRTGGYPEALICKTSYYNKVKQREWEAKALLLLELPLVLVPAGQSQVMLGIDFGSTGTNVYHCSPGQTPQPVLFANRIRQITDFDPNQFNAFNRDLFVPAKEWAAKNILSVFHDFGDPRGGENDRLVLRDGHILYLDDPGEFQPAERNRVKSNLKWGGERERLVAHDFLKQLCLQAAAEMGVLGVTSVDLRFSYPTAFSVTDIAKFGVSWKGISPTMKEFTGLSFTVNSGGINNCEAVAATRFFSDHTGNADITGAAITIDIGGGTTDLAVWSDLKLHSHSSILFAGRDIFLMPLRKRPEVLSDIEPRVLLDRLQKSQRDAAFNAHLDAIVARWGDKLIEVLHIKEARPSVRGFLRLLRIGLCGIGFFAGLMIRRLVEKQSIDKTTIGSISIFAGGNGSKMFRWCALGEFSEQTEIFEQFSKSFRAGADWKTVRVHVQLSKEPKAEVAYGLVSTPLTLPVVENCSSSLAGEEFKVGKDAAGKRNWTDAPTWPDIQALSVAVDRTMPIFQQFLASLELTLEPGLLDKIGGSIDLRYRQQASEIEAAITKDKNLKGQDQLRNEPIFIMALKKLLDMETEEWTSRV